MAETCFIHLGWGIHIPSLSHRGWRYCRDGGGDNISQDATVTPVTSGMRHNGIPTLA